MKSDEKSPLFNKFAVALKNADDIKIKLDVDGATVTCLSIPGYRAIATPLNEVSAGHLNAPKLEENGRTITFPHEWLSEHNMWGALDIAVAKQANKNFGNRENCTISIFISCALRRLLEVTENEYGCLLDRDYSVFSFFESGTSELLPDGSLKCTFTDKRLTLGLSSSRSYAGSGQDIEDDQKYYRRKLVDFFRILQDKFGIECVDVQVMDHTAGIIIPGSLVQALGLPPRLTATLKGDERAYETISQQRAEAKAALEKTLVDLLKGEKDCDGVCYDSHHPAIRRLTEGDLSFMRIEDNGTVKARFYCYGVSYDDQQKIFKKELGGMFDKIKDKTATTEGAVVLDWQNAIDIPAPMAKTLGLYKYICHQQGCTTPCEDSLEVSTLFNAWERAIRSDDLTGARDIAQDLKKKCILPTYIFPKVVSSLCCIKIADGNIIEALLNAEFIVDENFKAMIIIDAMRLESQQIIETINKYLLHQYLMTGGSLIAIRPVITAISEGRIVPAFEILSKGIDTRPNILQCTTLVTIAMKAIESADLDLFKRLLNTYASSLGEFSLEKLALVALGTSKLDAFKLIINDYGSTLLAVTLEEIAMKALELSELKFFTHIIQKCATSIDAYGLEKLAMKALELSKLDAFKLIINDCGYKLSTYALEKIAMKALELSKLEFFPHIIPKCATRLGKHKLEKLALEALTTSNLGAFKLIINDCESKLSTYTLKVIAMKALTHNNLEAFQSIIDSYGSKLSEDRLREIAMRAIEHDNVKAFQSIMKGCSSEFSQYSLDCIITKTHEKEDGFSFYQVCLDHIEYKKIPLQSLCKVFSRNDVATPSEISTYRCLCKFLKDIPQIDKKNLELLMDATNKFASEFKKDIELLVHAILAICSAIKNCEILIQPGGGEHFWTSPPSIRQKVRDTIENLTRILLKISNAHDEKIICQEAMKSALDHLACHSWLKYKHNRVQKLVNDLTATTGQREIELKSRKQVSDARLRMN